MIGNTRGFTKYFYAYENNYIEDLDEEEIEEMNFININFKNIK
jgi:hypothetical protein